MKRRSNSPGGHDSLSQTGTLPRDTHRPLKNGAGGLTCDEKWVRTDADRKAVASGCYFDEAAGLRVVQFVETFLKLNKGKWAGKPFQLMPWQINDVLMPVFGWKRENGTRRYRVAYIEIPKKNGKSAIASAISLYMLMADGESGAEVYSAAADRQQASIVFNEAASMVRASPMLLSRLEVIDSRKTIAYRANNSFFRALAADSDSNEGLNIHSLIFDELHAQKSPKLWDALRYGGAARSQPLMMAITTAGVDRHSIAWEQHEYAQNVLNGVIEDDSYFAYIRAAAPEDDWTAEETWYKANPSLGVTIDIDDFRKDCAEAREIPRKENPFKRYRLNLWTEQEHRWLPMAGWDAASGSVNADALAGRTCWGGLDLSIRGDLSAFVLVFPDDDDGYTLLPWFWIPEDDATTREHADRVPYLTWARQGFISLTSGNEVDYRVIRAAINEAAKKYNIRDVGFDRWNACQLRQQLQDDDGIDMVDFGQGFASMSAPSKHFELLVKAGKIRHGGHPVLRWNASNAVADMDPAGNIKPTKDPKKMRGRIDGIVASIMGIGRAMVNSNNTTSVYATRGILTI